MTKDKPIWISFGLRAIYGMEVMIVCIVLAVMLWVSIGFGQANPSAASWEKWAFVGAIDAGLGLQYLIACALFSWAAGVTADRHCRGAPSIDSEEDREMLARLLPRWRRLSSVTLWSRGLAMDEVMSKLTNGGAAEVRQNGEGGSVTLTRETVRNHLGMWGWAAVAAAAAFGIVACKATMIASVACAITALVLAAWGIWTTGGRSSLFRAALAVQVLVLQV